MRMERRAGPMEGGDDRHRSGEQGLGEGKGQDLWRDDRKSRKTGTGTGEGRWSRRGEGEVGGDRGIKVCNH